jgi:hypothetical protein
MAANAINTDKSKAPYLKTWFGNSILHFI